MTLIAIELSELEEIPWCKLPEREGPGSMQLE